MRLVVGPDHRLLLPASVLAGALFLLAADTFVRTFFYSHFGTEIPVGVVTAMCGGPFFLFLLKRGQKKAFFD
jgi:iron complex transport system permease protein